MTLDREQRRAIRRELAEFSATHTDAETAHRYSVCDKTVKDARREFGIKKQMHKVRQQVRVPSAMHILARLLKGEQQAEIAKDMGMARQWVSAIYNSAKAAGIFDAVRVGKPKRGSRS